MPNWIKELTDPRIQFFRELKGQHPRLSATGQILIEGEEQLKRALSFGVVPETVFMEPTYQKLLQFPEQTTVLLAERELMEGIVGYRLHRGLMALAPRPKQRPLPELPLPALALNEVTDPENVGTIARTAVAFGFRGIIVDAGSSDPYSRRAIRVSMGAVFGLQIFLVERLKEVLACAPHVTHIGIDSGRGGEGLREFPSESVYYFGNEKRGLSPELLQSLTHIVEIPMVNSSLGSINVAAAAAIICAKASGAV